MVLNKSWLLLALPVAVVALILLSLTAVSLLRTVRKSVVMSVPLRAEQSITFKESGQFVLNIESDSLSRGVSGLGFAIAKEGSSATVPLRTVLVRTKVSSFTRTRRELYSFDIRDPGPYTLRTSGVDSNTSNAAIVITRSFTMALVLHVLALVALGAMLIGSLVVTGLVLAKRPT